MSSTRAPAADEKVITIDLSPAGIKRSFRSLWEDLKKENLGLRVCKCVIGTTTCLVIVLATKKTLGDAAYLACVASVFGHPGRRFGAMAEALALGSTGCLLGILWSSIGIFCSGRVIFTNPEASAGIRSAFLIIALFLHGIIRSLYPRLFFFALLYIIVCTVGLTGNMLDFNWTYVTMFVFPIFTAVGVMLATNLIVFPELGSTHLGLVTIQALQSSLLTIRAASKMFVSGEPRDALPDTLATLGELTAQKRDLRLAVDKCKAVYQECSFELAYSYIPPKDLKEIGVKNMRKFVDNVIALIGACESRFTANDSSNIDGSATPHSPLFHTSDSSASLLQILKPRRELGRGCEDLLNTLLESIKVPLLEFQTELEDAIDAVMMNVAYAYGVTKLPPLQGVDPGKDILVQRTELRDIDAHLERFNHAIENFSKRSLDALERSASTENLSVQDIMPRDEIFLISSFFLNLKQAGRHTYDMLKHSRTLMERREERNRKPIHLRKHFHLPSIQIAKWLKSGNEDGDGLVHKKEKRKQKKPLGSNSKQRMDPMDDDSDSDSDDELEKKMPRNKRSLGDALPTRLIWRTFKSCFSWGNLQSSLTKEGFNSLWKSVHNINVKAHEGAADILDWARESEDFLFSAKLTFGAFLLSWPAFVNRDWNTWYFNMNAVWCPIVFIVVFQDVFGPTIWVFFLRTLGTITGAAWGLGAFKARDGNPYVIAVMLCIAFFFSFYVQIGTQFQKAGLVLTISMCLVSLGSYLTPEKGSPEINFTKRSVTMVIGGIAALIVHTVVFPIKSRNVVLECLSHAVNHLIHMESCIATGVDEDAEVIPSKDLEKKFDKYAKKVESALQRAEVNLGYVDTEPRLKGNMKVQKVVYEQMIYLVRQISERLQNLLHLRNAYGNIVLEDFRPRIAQYRRNLAASITASLYVVSLAIATKSPLPQFFPSAKLAHRRMTIRVRQLLMEDATSNDIQMSGEQASETVSPSASTIVLDTFAASSPDLLNNMHPTASTLSLPPLRRPPLISTNAARAAQAAMRALRLKVVSWNASAAALLECIELIEELIEYSKRVFGAYEFQAGLLTKEAYSQTVADIERDHMRNFELSGMEGGSLERESTTLQIGKDDRRDNSLAPEAISVASLITDAAVLSDTKRKEKEKEEGMSSSMMKKVESATGGALKKVESATSGRMPGRQRSASEVTMPVLERMRSRRAATRMELKREGSMMEKREEGR